MRALTNRVPLGCRQDWRPRGALCVASARLKSTLRSVERFHGDTRCSNCARPANTATRHCHRTPVKRASAPTNAPSVRRASGAFSTTSARTVAAGSSRGRSGRRRTGGVTTFSAKTLRAPESGTGLSIRQRTQSSPRQSGTFPRSDGSRPRRSALEALANGWETATTITCQAPSSRTRG